MSKQVAYGAALIVILAILIGTVLLLRSPGDGSVQQTTPTGGTVTPGGTTPIQTPTKYSIVITTGTVGGVYFYYGSTVAGLIANFTDLEATSTHTGASIDNLLLIRDKTDLKKGVIYCGTVLPDSAYLAYKGIHDAFKERPAPIKILWAMYPNHLHIVTTVDSGIRSLADLKDKRVSTGPPGSGTEIQALLILELLGMKPDRDFKKWERLGPAESSKLLLEGGLDAFFWSGGLPTASIVELSRSLALKGKQIYLVPIDENTARAFANKYPGLASRSVIPAATYGAPSDTPSLSFWNVFVCHKDAPEEVVYKITRAVFENLPTLHRAVAAARDTNLENALRLYGGEIPYHEGALRYFREKGALRG